MLFLVDHLNGGAYNLDASANRFFDLSTRSMSKERRQKKKRDIE